MVAVTLLDIGPVREASPDCMVSSAVSKTLSPIDRAKARKREVAEL
jgi:hypothetical protein